VTLPDLLSTFEPLEIGDGFVLRAVVIDDADVLAAFVDVNRDHLGRFLPGLVAEIIDVETARLHCEQMVALQAQGELLEMHLFDGELLCGAIRLRDVDGYNRSGNIGYLLGAEHAGRGLATRMVSRFVEWAFDALQMHRIELRCVATNVASAAVALRLGFTLEGRLRDCELIDDEFHDDLVFSRLRSDDVEGASK
jgi:ribosomal-protein-serine acetyltransferase